MADFNSSLPVRTEAAGDIVAKIGDGTTPSQQLAIDSSGRIITKLDDGSGNLITSQANGGQRALDVGINVSGVQVDPRAIRALTTSDAITATTNADGSLAGGTAGSKSLAVGGVYNSSAPTLTTGQQASLQLDASGNLKTTFGGTVTVIGSKTPSDAYANPTDASDDLSLLMGYNGATWDRLRASTANGLVVDVSRIVAALPAGTNLIGAIKVSDGTNLAAVKAASTAAAAGDTSLVVGLSPNSPLPAGTNLLGAINIDIGGTTVSNTNPMPVTVLSSVPGTAVQSYQTSAALAAAANVDLTYTVTALKTLSLQRVYSSASGKIKVIVSVETGVATGSYTTKFVGFNSTAEPNIDMTIVAPISVAAGVRVKVNITNEDKVAQDVYTTIEGSEI